MKVNTKTSLIHISGSPDPETKSVIPPLCLSTIFAMEEPSSHDGFQYGRVGNPTRSILEETLANLHSAKHACVFSSGSAAIMAVLSTLRCGDHIVCHDMIYEGTVRLLTNLFNKFGISVTFVDLKDPSSLMKAWNSHTKIVLLETPTNPLLELIDIHEIAGITHRKRAMLVVDNTFAGPLIQQPLLHGADVVVESLTKGINGHSDAMGGLVATNNDSFFESIRFIQHTAGAILSPFECFLIQRGLKTLPLRNHQQQRSACIVAKWLQKQPAIAWVQFPGLKLKIIKQMKGPGAIIAFRVNPKIVRPDLFLSRLKIITIAHSLGGSETLIQQPTTMMDLSFSEKQLGGWGITDNFFRLSVGLEHVADIIADLKQAIDSKR